MFLTSHAQVKLTASRSGVLHASVTAVGKPAHPRRATAIFVMTAGDEPAQAGEGRFAAAQESSGSST
jgi:hypothetical protein